MAGALLAAGGFLAREGWAYWHERSARQAMADEQLDEAQRHIDSALVVCARRESTQLLAARIARLRGEYAEAEQHLSACGQQGEMSEPLQLEWKLLLCQLGKVDELASGLVAAVRGNDSESIAILEALAAVYMRQMRYMEALGVLNHWIELAPDTVRALDWRGWVNNQIDHRQQAMKDYERALELQPGRSAVRLRLAEILVESSQPREALEHLERLREEQPANAQVLVALARCRMAEYQMDDARAALDAALAARPDDFDALLQRGKLELQAANYSEAERWLRMALERDPREPVARFTLYQSLLAQTGREAEAEEVLARWRRDRQIQERLGYMLRTELHRKPNDPDVALETGELFLQLGEDQRGLFWLNRALSLNSRHAPSLQALIAYYERTNNPAKAAEHRRLLDALSPAK